MSRTVIAVLLLAAALVAYAAGAASIGLPVVVLAAVAEIGSWAYQRSKRD